MRLWLTSVLVVMGGFALALASTAEAAIVVMDFDTVPDGTPMPYGGTFVQNGMKATSYSNFSILSDNDALKMLPTNALYFHGNDGADSYAPAATIGPNNAYIDFRMVDGSKFDLLSLDLVSGGNYGTPERRWITTSAGSTYWPLFQDTLVVVHLTFSGSNYTQIDWFRVGTQWFATELDNVTFNVPEPATIIVWSLLGGLAVAAGWRRWRKAA
jgi:hypothetical protein